MKQKIETSKKIFPDLLTIPLYKSKKTVTCDAEVQFIKER